MSKEDFDIVGKIQQAPNYFVIYFLLTVISATLIYQVFFDKKVFVGVDGHYFLAKQKKDVVTKGDILTFVEEYLENLYELDRQTYEEKRNRIGAVSSIQVVNALSVMDQQSEILKGVFYGAIVDIEVSEVELGEIKRDGKFIDALVKFRRVVTFKDRKILEDVIVKKLALQVVNRTKHQKNAECLEYSKLKVLRMDVQ